MTAEVLRQFENASVDSGVSNQWPTDVPKASFGGFLVSRDRNSHSRL